MNKTIKKIAELLRKCYNDVSDINEVGTQVYYCAKVKLYDLLNLLQLIHEETGWGISPKEILQSEKDLTPPDYWTELCKFIEELEASA